MNFFDWTYGTKADSAIAQDVSLEEHDRRFHPKGYKEGDICSLRDTANREDSLPIDNGSSEKAVSLLRNWLPGVKIVEDDSVENLEKSLTDDVRMFVKHSDYVNWSNTIDRFKDHQGSFKANSTMQIASAIPDVIAKCYRESGFTTFSVKGIWATEGMLEKVTSRWEYHEAKVDRYGKKHEHHIQVDDLKKIPLTIDKPLAVFRSYTEPYGIVAVCPIEDTVDGKKQFSTVCLNYAVGTFDNVERLVTARLPTKGEDGNMLVISTANGRPWSEIKGWVDDGLLMYVDPEVVRQVEGSEKSQRKGESLRDLKLASYIGKRSRKTGGVATNYIVELKNGKIIDKSEQIKQEQMPKVQKVMSPSDFRESYIGEILPDDKTEPGYGYKMAYGKYKIMREMLDKFAKSKGLYRDGATNLYVGKDADGKRIEISADLQEWDGEGNPLSLEERFTRNHADRTYRIMRKGDTPIGWYNRTTGEVHLVKGLADVETVAHELGWHASFHNAEKNNPALYAQMRRYAETAPDGIKEAVLKVYGNDLKPDELLDEIGARRFTEENLEIIKDELKRQTAKGWFGKMMDGVKTVWRGFVEKVSANSLSGEMIGMMSPEDCMKVLAKAFASGKTLSASTIAQMADASKVEPH